MAITFHSDGGQAAGVRVGWWDFLFYALFGLAVTSFVHIGGVLLVFSYLVIPAVCASYLAQSLRARLAVGLVVATVASIACLALTARVDLPIGAAIVCGLGLMLILSTFIALFRRR